MGYYNDETTFKIEENASDFYGGIRNEIGNAKCDWDSVPDAVDYLESLGDFGVSLVSIGVILSATTLYLVIDTLHNVMIRNETSAYKTNCWFVLTVYPIASFCSLLGAAVPRGQLLSEALTQISLTIGLYRLFLLLIDLGHRSVAKPPPITLRVEPCCCWPCLPFPNLELNKGNLAWLRLCVLQLPILQGLTYCALLFMNAEDSMLAQRYGMFLQPFAIISLLFGIYGISVTAKSLQDCAPGAYLHQRSVVLKLVLLFSKLQGFIVKSLPATGVFPCNPPLTPQIYANLTYNCLMIIQMLLLAYAAKQIYAGSEKSEDPEPILREGAENKEGPLEVTNNNILPNVQLPVRIAALTA